MHKINKMKKLLSTKYNENIWSLGLLLLRVTFGLIMMKHGLDKLTDYNNVKGMNQLFGSPTDALLVIFAEFFCAVFIVLGLFTRFAAIPLIITMAVAFFKVHNHIIFCNKCASGSGEVALLYLVAFTVLLLTGPGKFSVDKMIAK